MLKKISEFIVTVGYIGKIKFAPGSFGSLAAFPLSYLIMHLVMVNNILLPIPDINILEQEIITIFIMEIIAILFLFIIGLYFTDIYISGNKNTDPKEVVIDELVGQMIVIVFCSLSIVFTYDPKLVRIVNVNILDFVILFLSPFIMFRIFDIFKPWPINWVDQNIKNSMGVMLDDIAAAGFAIISHYAFVFILLDFVSR